MATPKKTIGVNMAESTASEIEKRAESMSLSTSAYCKIILENWVASGKKLELIEV